MAFDFSMLPAKARRAAFAHMTASDKAKSKGKQSTRARLAAQTVPNIDTGGRISLEDAAIRMFGTAGAAARFVAADRARARKRTSARKRT